MMNAENILNELKAGRELVIIGADEWSDSAIHNVTRDGKTWRRYAREFGEVITPLNEADFINFINELQQDGATLIIRGCPYDKR